MSSERYLSSGLSRETVYKAEIAASHAINRNPSTWHYQLGLLEPILTRLHAPKSSEDAQLSVSRDMRRVLMRVFADRRATSLFPFASDFLQQQQQSSIIARYEQEQWFQDVQRARVFDGDRERKHTGGEAVIAATLEHFYAEANTAMYKLFRERGEYDIFSQAYREQTENVNKQAQLIASQKGINLDLPTYPIEGDQRGRAQRLVTILANPRDSGITPDLEKILTINSRGQAEFYTVALLDLYKKFEEVGVPEAIRLQTALENVQVLSLLAALKDERVGELLFKGYNEGKHKNIWNVVYSPETGRWIVTGVQPPLKEFSEHVQERSRYGRCPATDVMSFFSTEDENAYEQLVKNTVGLETRMGNERMSSAEIIVVAAIGVVDQLLRKDIITLKNQPQIT